MKAGDAVRVWPHGKEHLAAAGVVLIISDNQRSIAVVFEDKPPFVGREGFMMHQEFGFGIVMMASREQLNGAPWGPWVELIGEGHYEIEEVQ